MTSIEQRQASTVSGCVADRSYALDWNRRDQANLEDIRRLQVITEGTGQVNAINVADADFRQQNFYARSQGRLSELPGAYVLLCQHDIAPRLRQTRRNHH